MASSGSRPICPNALDSHKCQERTRRLHGSIPAEVSSFEIPRDVASFLTLNFFGVRTAALASPAMLIVISFAPVPRMATLPPSGAPDRKDNPEAIHKCDQIASKAAICEQRYPEQGRSPRYSHHDG